MKLKGQSMNTKSIDESTPKMKRKAISKKLRFEVFKRDSFKCQYCGKCAPDVILHVDHINPVSKGGANDILNLITSCFECNNGKSDRLISDDSAMAKQRAQLEELNVRREQLEQMLAWRDGMKGIDSMAFKAAVDAWEEVAVDFHLSETGEKTLKKLVEKFGLQCVLDSIGKAEQYIKHDFDGSVTVDSANAAWSKVGAICRMASQPDWKRDLYYIRGICRNRFSYVNETECMRLLEDAHEAGVELDYLKDIAKSTNNWTAFRRTMNEILEGSR